MSDTQPFDLDPIDSLEHAPSDDVASRLANDLRNAAGSDHPVRIDPALADLFAPPTPQPRRRWRPALLLRPAATVAAAFVAVLVLGAGAVALVGPDLVDTITGGDRSSDAPRDVAPEVDIVRDDISPDAGDSADRSEGETAVSEEEREKVLVDLDGADRPDDVDANAVNEEAVAVWVGCMEAGFDLWLDSLGSEEGVLEGMFADCPTSDEGSLGVAGHQYKDALQEWLGCASKHAHETLKAGVDGFDVVEACGDIPRYADFGIDVASDADADEDDRVADVRRRSDELSDDRGDTGEGRSSDEGSVRNGSSDEERSSPGRTGEG